MAGRWWGTKATVTVNGVATPNPCVQSSPCTWSDLLVRYPNIGIHSLYGAIVLKAGSGWTSFRGNVDALLVGIDGATTAYDFEAVRAPAVPALPPDQIPAALYDTAQFVGSASFKIHRSLLVVQFEDSVSQSTRAQLIGSIGGRVVGGEPSPGGGDGPYYVQVTDDPTGDVNRDLAEKLDTLPAVVAAYPFWIASADSALAYRKPKKTDRPDWSVWEVDPSKANSTHNNWAFDVIRAPMAWGCETGNSTTEVAVLDFFFHTESQLGSNRAFTSDRDIRPPNVSFPGTFHGDLTSQLLGARGNDSVGMTGVMWNASLRQYDVGIKAINPTTGLLDYSTNPVTLSAKTVKDAVIAAARAGARVINRVIEYRALPGRQPSLRSRE